jgi:hypothetical protein
VRIAVGRPSAAIPDHHGAAAILALGDGALERVVFDRMVLDVDREALFVGIEAWPAGDAQLFITPSSSSRKS